MFFLDIHNTNYLQNIQHRLKENLGHETINKSRYVISIMVSTWTSNDFKNCIIFMLVKQKNKQKMTFQNFNLNYKT